jgi:hypothetical protein
MSGFYEVTTASGCGGGRRVHEKAPVWAGCCVSHPAADRTLTGASDAAARRLLHSPYGLAMNATGLLHSPSQQAQRNYTAVAQTPEGLTGSLVRVGSKNPKVIARPRCALLGLGAPSAFHGRHSERRPGFRRRVCATASVQLDRLKLATDALALRVNRQSARRGYSSGGPGFRSASRSSSSVGSCPVRSAATATSSVSSQDPQCSSPGRSDRPLRSRGEEVVQRDAVHPRLGLVPVRLGVRWERLVRSLRG